MKVFLSAGNLVYKEYILSHLLKADIADRLFERSLENLLLTELRVRPDVHHGLGFGFPER